MFGMKSGLPFLTWYVPFCTSSSNESFPKSMIAWIMNQVKTEFSFSFNMVIFSREAMLASDLREEMVINVGTFIFKSLNWVHVPEMLEKILESISSLWVVSWMCSFSNFFKPSSGWNILLKWCLVTLFWVTNNSKTVRFLNLEITSNESGSERQKS